MTVLVFSVTINSNQERFIVSSLNLIYKCLPSYLLQNESSQIPEFKIGHNLPESCTPVKDRSLSNSKLDFCGT